MKIQLSLLKKIALAIIIIWALLFLKSYIFSNDEREIRKVLSQLSTLCTISGEEHPFERLRVGKELSEIFTERASLFIRSRRLIDTKKEYHTESRKDLQKKVALFRTHIYELQVSFVDINITVSGNLAYAHLTAKAKFREFDNGEQYLEVIELKFSLQKIDGKWLIASIENLHAVEY